MKKKYYLVMSYTKAGRQTTLTATSDVESRVKRLWHRLVEQCCERCTIIENHFNRIVVSYYGAVRELSYGSYEFAEEDPFANTYSL